MVACIYQPVVDLVGDHDQVVLLSNAGDFRECFQAGYRPGRVVRVADKDDLGARRNGCFNFLWHKREVVLHPAGDFNGNTSSNMHISLVGDETRRGDDDLITRIEQSGQGQEKGFRPADRNHHFPGRIILDTI